MARLGEEGGEQEEVPSSFGMQRVTVKPVGDIGFLTGRLPPALRIQQGFTMSWGPNC